MTVPDNSTTAFRRNGHWPGRHLGLLLQLRHLPGGDAATGHASGREPTRHDDHDAPGLSAAEVQEGSEAEEGQVRQKKRKKKGK